MSRPAENMTRPITLKRPLVATPSLDSGSSGIIEQFKILITVSAPPLMPGVIASLIYRKN